ncbi:exodeoxyribonuclease VII large subunit [Inquilinus sp. CAU 1745]|uniref:exodeoxyribonuclease VII large subunit n=1 Tax=Inquilinus sp. CAU 1745 TaxID=3140369 RepID=UPI00325A9614
MTQDTVPTRGVRPNTPEYTVSEISTAVKRTVEDGFAHVRVRGEISRPKMPGSGHLYLTLKDDGAVLDAVCWRGSVSRLSIRPEEGMEVICTGRLTTYAGQSKYQLVVEQMELAGEGALLKLLEDRRRRLASEGLFDEARKQRLPFLPDVIGVVTSPTGAVIRDILHRLEERFPRHVLLWPVPVQGQGAAEKIAAAIEGFNALPQGGVPRPDVLIVARGGGSLEDLMAFNEEIVVRAAAASAIPLISAVGHETDTTLIDHAADRRAPTPTAAAEMAVPVRNDLLVAIRDRQVRMLGGLSRLVAERRMRVEGLGRGLGDPARLLEGASQRLDDRSERLARCLPVLLDRRRGALAEASARLRHPRQQLAEAERHLRQLGHRLSSAGYGSMTRHRQRFEGTARLSPHPMKRAIADGARRLGESGSRLPEIVARRLDRLDERLKGQGKLLVSYSYEGVLERGFAIVHDDRGDIVDSRAKTSPGKQVTLEFADGKVGAVVAGGAVPERRRPAPAPKQGTLL